MGLTVAAGALPVFRRVVWLAIELEVQTPVVLTVPVAAQAVEAAVG